MTTTAEQTDELYEACRAFVGGTSDAATLARDEVNQAMIRHWCDAMGDANPVYTDPEAAAASVHGGIVAPPTMLQAWTMQGLAPRAVEPDDPAGSIRDLLDAAGYTSVVATNCEQTYERYLRPGDLLSVIGSVDDVSPRKQTGLGEGYFVTTKMTYTDQHGEVVGTQLFRILKFRPPTAS